MGRKVGKKPIGTQRIGTTTKQVEGVGGIIGILGVGEWGAL